MIESLELARSRRKDPNYMQISADLPKPLALKLRAVCVVNEISQSEAIEQAVIMWLQAKGEEIPPFEPPQDFEDGRRTP